MKAVLETSEGDMRKAITYLQSAGRLKPDEIINAEDICEIAGVCLLPKYFLPSNFATLWILYVPASMEDNTQQSLMTCDS